MKAIDVIGKFSKGTQVEIRIRTYGQTFYCCHSAEMWMDEYTMDAENLLDKEIGNMFMYEGKLIINLVD